ncbi:MAG: hypothetical protein A2579_06670 [Lysobacterales bacterium RIFOXYD1_FULL_69_11]|nr:MAG: hypothetical protein A2190_08905 [Xanthomonadales bacterium RIFOXYA1_FULL_69_10]OHE88522.1 MAG: hypothetical protein A2579_06670 [Xanthomonadales bacterium RIFOXYD1_FULL_69_11]
MRRTPLALLPVATLSLAVALIAGRTDTVDAATPQKGVVAQAATSAPGTRMEAEQALDASVAAALIGAVAGQFDEDNVEVRLTDVDVEEASLRDRQLLGRGELKLGESNEWIPFGFEALYDTVESVVSYPRLTLADGASAKPVDLDTSIATTLSDRAEAALVDEFAQQPVSLALEDVRSVDAGERYLRVDASGTADFGREGNAAAQVHGLFDQQENRWVRVSYELGEAPQPWAADHRVASR